MRVLVAGASGFLGTHLVTALRQRGHGVTTLTRGDASGPDQSSWDPYADKVDRDLVAGVDVVINLAGSPTLGNPHSKKWARALRESRITTTRVLAEAIAAAASPPAFLAGNGISFYGDHGSDVLTESSDSRGDALLTSVTRQWEEATAPAAAAGSRVCILRTAPVMDGAAPPLKPLALLTRLGLGTRLGNGEQYMAMISLRDWVGGVVHLAEHETAAGPFNLCCSRTPTNGEFTRALAAAVHRPAFVFVPRGLLKVAAGEMASELLNSLNVRPEALENSGYVISDPDVTAVLATALR
jgi:uncharacterized protein (TIGR01777 family)